MLAVEQRVINISHRDGKTCDDLAFRSKNIFNQANSCACQHLLAVGKALSLKEIYDSVKESDAYKALPRKVSNRGIKQVDKAWKSYLAAIEFSREHPEKFKKPPRIPRYKDKTKGRNTVTYDCPAVGRGVFKKGLCSPSQSGLLFPTQATAINEVRPVPKCGCYVIEVVDEKPETTAGDLHPEWIAGIDLGLGNLAAVASNKAGFKPFLINGRPLKALNQYYNKREASLQSRLPKNRKWSRQLRDLTHKRSQQVRNFLHQATRHRSDRLVAHKIGKLVIGDNEGWKTEISRGKVNNQNFTNIPQRSLVNMLAYLAQLAGNEVVFTEESCPSKCSFLDLESVHKHDSYLGKRVKRGLFRSANGMAINAALNGAYNTLGKVFGNNCLQFDKGSGCRGAQPVKVNPLRA